MKYYGNSDYNRMETIASYPMAEINNPNSAIGFINQKGMLFEYLVNKENTSKHYKKGHLTNEAYVYYQDCTGFKKKRYKKETYYIGVREEDHVGKGGIECYVLYKQLPRIANDDTFRWKENLKYGTKETVIIQGNFEFTCIVKADGDAIVDVRYTKCDNKHRNRVTITRIEVYNAANEEILKAIKEWKEMFQNEMNNNTKTITDIRLVS